MKNFFSTSRLLAVLFAISVFIPAFWPVELQQQVYNQAFAQTPPPDSLVVHSRGVRLIVADANGKEIASYDTTTGLVRVNDVTIGQFLSRTTALLRIEFALGQIGTAPQPPPPVDCVLSAPGAWATTNLTTCVGNLRTRSEERTLSIVTEPRNGGAACAATTQTQETEEACESGGTAVDCVLGAPSDWTGITPYGTCVAGQQTRTEERTYPIVTQPANGGAACAATSETREVAQACTLPATESAQGARVLRGSTGYIVDSEGSTWTIRGGVAPMDGDVLRNGVHFNGGWASEILYHNQEVLHRGYSVLNWFRWTGSTWQDLGTNDPLLPEPSANHTRIPTNAVAIRDNLGRVWTLVNQDVHVDGEHFHGGWATQILFEDGVVYHKNPSGLGWLKEDADGIPDFWENTGLNDPETGLPDDFVPGAPPVSLRSTTTTGSISGGSNVLTVASTAGFLVDDWVIVETGHEAGAGIRGTKGVGGTWPGTTYATEAALLAAASTYVSWQADVFAWAENTGEVYWYYQAYDQWFSMHPVTPARSGRPQTWFHGSYYLGKAMPRALQAQITAIGAGTLTLNRNAVVAATGANVYLDVAPIITALTASSTTTTLPAGNFATGGAIWILNKTGVTLAGQGKNSTRIFSPKGVPSAGIEVYNSPTTTLKDFELWGNFADEGFGANWGGSTPAPEYGPVTDANAPQGGSYTGGIRFNRGSNNGIAQDLRVKNVPSQAVGVAYSNTVWAYRIENIQEIALRNYVQWQFQWTDTSGGGCVDCTITSPYAHAGFEAFKSSNVSFIRPVGVNSRFSMNGASNFLIEDANLSFTNNALNFTTDPYMREPTQPIVNINNHINQPPGSLNAGGIIRRMTITQTGYLNPANDTYVGIKVGPENPNVRIEGLKYTASDYIPGSQQTIGAQAVSMWGSGGFIKDVVVTGLARHSMPHEANIYAQTPAGGVYTQNGGGNQPDPRTPGSIHFFRRRPSGDRARHLRRARHRNGAAAGHRSRCCIPQSMHFF